MPSYNFPPKLLNLFNKKRLYSEVEISQPQKYLDRFINKYDGFSRIYFNEKEKKNNKLNNKFYYMHVNNKKADVKSNEVLNPKNNLDVPKFDVCYTFLIILK